MFMSEFDEAKYIEKTAIELVETKSVNGTSGEVDEAEKIVEILRRIPYFQKHRDAVWTKELPNDPLGRKNVFAFLKKKGTQKTVLYHSHFDTVGTKDFGPLESDATHPDVLAERFKSFEEDEDVRNDAESGDWVFGRGALDMKSGDAVNIANIRYFAEHQDELEGNLLFMGNCVEENDHLGIIAALDELERLKDEEGLEYTIAINTDFISPKYPGDRQKYVYYGAAGKILTCVYVRGIETHVGNTYDGLNSTVIASRLNCLLDNNPELVEKFPGEEILPSTCLMIRDQKDFYNVQTPKTTRMYFNTFTYQKPACELLDSFEKEIKAECLKMTDLAKRRRSAYLSGLGFPKDKDDRAIDVYTFAEYAEMMKKRLDFETECKRFAEQRSECDKRTAGFELLDHLEELAGDGRAKIVLFIAPPFCPHNAISEDSKAYRALKETFFEPEYVLKKYFPYLSDSSYIAVDETPAELERMKNDFPLEDFLYPLPYETMRKLSIPAVDLGVFGKGAHTFKERVYKPYSYGILPEKIRTYTKLMWK